MMTNRQFEYVGKDLEAMDFAENYHRWILDVFGPFLGKRLVEVGAGTGSFSELLLGRSPEKLVLIEPSNMFASLTANLNDLSSKTSTAFFNSTFSEAAPEVKAGHHPDSIIYINVLEHIRDDIAELVTVFETLRPGGRIFIFVPALAVLYSNFDRQIGHFRRYNMNDLKHKCRAVGFDILIARNFDMPGILPWLLKYRILRSLKMEAGAVAFYDKFAVPIIRKFETFLPPPIGKNLILVAEKPSS
jgi:phospholipid N-methyltransferase